MKKLLLVIFLLLAPSLANAQASKNDLIGLGMAPELANELVKGTVSNSSYIIQVDNDPQRKFTFDASSDTALTLKFGDGTTAGQFFTISASDSDAADNDYLALAGGGLDSTSRGAWIQLMGNEQGDNGAAYISTGNKDANSDLRLLAFDDIILTLTQDSNRLITFDSSSDTALAMKFGDSGTTATQVFSITASTTDTDDDSVLKFSGGGSADDNSRGAYLSLEGEQGGGRAIIGTGGATADILLQTNNATALTIDELGNTIIAKSSSGFASTVAGTVTAAGTTVTDATQLTAVWNIVSTVAANTGVKLWDGVNGIQICVQNAGANNLELYPPTSGATINAAAAGAGITLAAATDDIACCVEVASTQWVCTVDPGPAT